MLRFYAENWLAVVTNLERLRWQCLLGYRQDAIAAAATSAISREREETLRGLEQKAADLPLSLSLSRQIARFAVEVRKLDPTDRMALGTALTLCDELKFNLHAELEQQYFLMIEPRWRGYIVPSAAFGEGVETAFPDAALEIRAASRCLAFEQWTAAVFHLIAGSGTRAP